MAVGAQGGPRSLADPPRPMDHQASAVAEQTPSVTVAAIKQCRESGRRGGAGEDVCSSSTRLHDEAPAWEHGRLSTPGTSPRATSERPGQPCWELDPKAGPWWWAWCGVSEESAGRALPPPARVALGKLPAISRVLRGKWGHHTPSWGQFSLAPQALLTPGLRGCLVAGRLGEPRFAVSRSA